ncbi:hypothetical protein FRC11_009252, partial [Ceratobasidium sp. 423]
MSQPQVEQGEIDLNTVLQEIEILKTHITTLKEYITQEFEKLHQSNEEIKTIATTARDVAEDGAQGDEDETQKTLGERKGMRRTNSQAKNGFGR